MTNNQRAAFEAWLRVKPCGAAHDFAWEAWQAALASPEVQALREALIESDNQLKQVLASNTDGLVHVVNDEFHLCLEKNRSALAAMEDQK